MKNHDRIELAQVEPANIFIRNESKQANSDEKSRSHWIWYRMSRQIVSSEMKGNGQIRMKNHDHVNPAQANLAQVDLAQAELAQVEMMCKYFIRNAGTPVTGQPFCHGGH